MNKAFIIKKGIIKDAVILGPVLAVCLLIMGLSLYYSGSKTSELEEITSQSSSALTRINESKFKIEQNNKDSVVFGEIPEIRYKTGNGMKTIAQRIKESKPRLEELSGKYLTNIVELKIGAIEPYNQVVPTRFYIPNKDKVTMTMESVSDEMMLSFIYALKENMPGYVIYDKIDIAKQTKNIFGDIREAKSKGRQPGLVKGNLEFTWVVFEDTTESAKDSGNPVIQNAPQPVKEQGI
jgi:hypothetical protein